MTKTPKVSKNKQRNHPLNEVAGLWALRILLNLNGIASLSSFSYMGSNSEMLKSVDMGDVDVSDIDKKDIIKKLKTKQVRYEKNKPGIKGVLKKNLQQFSRLLGLSENERKILDFTVALYSHRGLEDTADTLGYLGWSDVVFKLSGILGIPVKKVQEALSTNSVLFNSGILKISKNGNAYLRAKLELMSGLNDVLQEPQLDMMGMVRDYFQTVTGSELVSDDFEYIRKDYGLISKYLTKAVKSKLAGVNILVHGRPGTGKSELVKTLASELGLKLYEISVADKDGDALTGNRRFSAYQLCQKILARQKKTLVLFDEVEDVFPDGALSIVNTKSNEDRRKAWINRLLETNPVPAIWVSNNIEQIDNAFIRRFDFVLKLDHPPKDIRANILNKHFAGLSVSSQWIENVAENPDIAPALVSRAARVALMIDESGKKPAETERHLEQIMGNTLEAMGYTGKVAQKQNVPLSYRLDVLNSDLDIHQLVEGLKYSPHGRLCLYGPPGTGKTEFGRHIARALEKPLLVKRASDLLGSYVGMTEKNIAGMYRQAQDEGAVLLLDEADSFLRDRVGARQSWEVTQVNEMLTQMESYEGVFICSTNLVDNLDPASLRRFDFKIYLDYLKADQTWVLFQQILKDQGTAITANNRWKEKLSRYSNLTPGDFATVLRQNRLCKASLNAESLFSGLTRESALKCKNKSTGIGFMATL